MDADTQNVGTRGTEPLMSDVEIKRTESLSREEAAGRLSALAAALSEGGHVEVELGASTVKLHVPDHVQCEVEVEVDGDDVELEVELTWSTAPVAQPASVPPPQSAPRQAGRTRSAKRAVGN
jgi:amphi-Trp domain-containing protein